MSTSHKRFSTSATALPGVYVVERQPLRDARGSLTRLFCKTDLAAVGWAKPVAQINQTRTSAKGTLRGLHFQIAPSAEMKLVMCLVGGILDVAVDLRRGSPSLLQVHHQLLTEANNTALVIPEGCAHGFQTLTDDVLLLYMHSAPFDAECERGFSALDPRIGIRWPLPPGPMSDRDRALPLVGNGFDGV